MFYHITYCLRPESEPLRAPYFTEHLQSLLLKVSGFQPANLLKKRLRKICFSVNFAKFLRTPFILTEHLRMTASCVYLWSLRRFSEHFLYRAPLFYVQVAEFQPPDTVKNYSTGAPRTFYTRSRSSHSKAFICLKFLETVYKEVNLLWSCEMPTRNFMKKALSHILRHVFCLHFLRMHLDTSSKEALEVWEHNFFLEM